MSSCLEWKTVSPGEQTTSTFHSYTYTNTNLWYKTRFYKMELLDEEEIANPERPKYSDESENEY